MLVEKLIDDCRSRLSAGGTLISTSGSAAWSGGSLAVYSDYGPPGQDKEVNQDYALLWLPGENAPRGGLYWAAAVADGVTCSFRPEWGAELACFHALASLIGRSSAQSPLEQATAAVGAAGEALGIAAERIAQRDEFRPADEFPATWRMRLKLGRLLQTTLTLAWLEDETLSIAMVGDGGAVVRLGGEAGRDEILGEGEPDTDLVHALGPANRRIESLDLWWQFPFQAGSTLALYTDGIRRAVRSSAGDLLDRATELLTAESAANVAEQLIRELLAAGAETLEDNLTLLIAKRD